MRQPCDEIPNRNFHDTMRKLLLLWEPGYTNPARCDFNGLDVRCVRSVTVYRIGPSRERLNVGFKPVLLVAGRNLQLKIREKFLECSGEFSPTPLVAAKLQKYVPLIVVELGP